MTIPLTDTFLSLSTCGVLTLGSAAAMADTKSSAEGVAVLSIAYSIRDYRLTHDGATPTNWSQLAESRNIVELNRSTFPVIEHYAFIVEHHIPMLDSRDGNVFMIRVTPVTNTVLGEVGRYVISRVGDGCTSKWLSEDKVQKMLTQAGVTTLPEPTPLNITTNPPPVLPQQPQSVPTTSGAHGATPANISSRIQPEAPPTRLPVDAAKDEAAPASFAEQKVLLGALMVVICTFMAFALRRFRDNKGIR